MGRTKEEIKFGARVFGNAAITLGVIGEAALKADEFSGQKIIAQNIIPSIVLKAFSCELFLKSLVQPDAFINIHKLNELFALLSENEKSVIATKVIQKLSSDDSTYNQDKFNLDLIEVANAFIDWRYFYEEPRTINIAFFNALFEVLSEK